MGKFVLHTNCSGIALSQVSRTSVGHKISSFLAGDHSITTLRQTEGRGGGTGGVGAGTMPGKNQASARARTRPGRREGVGGRPGGTQAGGDTRARPEGRTEHDVPKRSGMLLK